MHTHVNFAEQINSYELRIETMHVVGHDVRVVH